MCMRLGVAPDEVGAVTGLIADRAATLTVDELPALVASLRPYLAALLLEVGDGAFHALAFA